MGWVEKRDDGTEVLHELCLVNAAGEAVAGLRDLPSVEMWLLRRTPELVRTGCACSWSAEADGPPVPPVDPRWRSELHAPELEGWQDYHLSSWQRHLREVLPGTNADDPMNHLRAQVYALLDNPRAALNLLSRVEEDVRAAKAVAKWAITGVATPFTDEPSPRSGQVKIVLKNEFTHPG